MFLIQKVIAYYYPQCSGMPSVLDDDDVEIGNGSVTPLRYARCRNSNIPSVTDLTDLRDTAISKIKARPSTAAAKRKRSQSTVSSAAKRKPTRSTAAGARVKPPRSTAAARVKLPPRSTAAVAKGKNPETTSAMIHSGTDLLTSTVILMPEANENHKDSVNGIQEIV